MALLSIIKCLFTSLNKRCQQQFKQSRLPVQCFEKESRQRDNFLDSGGKLIQDFLFTEQLHMLFPTELEYKTSNARNPYKTCMPPMPPNRLSLLHV